MTTSFSSLPIVDLSLLSDPERSVEDNETIANQLSDVFSTTGFAYLVNAPLSFTHDEVFSLARDFFSIPANNKMKLAKNSFVRGNKNTYRGYFPPQPGQMDNLKEGFEVGPTINPSKSNSPLKKQQQQKFDLTEPNIWPSESSFPNGRTRLEKLHTELQSLSSTLLALLATALGKPEAYFADYLTDSLSTLRLLHYPPQTPHPRADEVKLCCTPHTDSGILTLLHQDPTGGLEVLNADGAWIAAPYVPGSIVVNIGDLMAEISGGRYVATMHRVRTSGGGASGEDGIGRLSVPFFFEPGEQCVVQSVDGGRGIVYGEHVRQKMGTWVEFQDVPERKIDDSLARGVEVEAF